jgi:pimeloyl-ACP methyl ester carboxylesterase
LPHFIASDGARIAYDDAGSGRPIVLLHGLMAHRGFFTRQLALADSFRVIAIDLRGHGESRQAGEAPSVEQLAHDVSALAHYLDLQDAIGIGWSLGASVLWHVLAGPASERFAGSVIVDMTPRVLNDDDWQLGLSREMCEARRRAIEEDFTAFATNAGQAIFAAPSDARIAAWAGREFARNDSAAISALWASLVEQDFRDILSRIRQPTLIVHGAHSHLYGSDTADHLGAVLLDSNILQFDRSGHSPHLEQPELFNQAIKDFAASLPRVRDVKIDA